jgi:hypothetical protein
VGELRLDVLQPRRGEGAGQLAAEVRVGTGGAQPGGERVGAPGDHRPGVGRPGGRLDRRGKRPAEDQVLQHQHAARAQRRHEPTDHAGAIGQVLHHHPRVHEVVRVGLQRVGGHVVLDHLDAGKLVEEPQVDVGRGHPSVGPTVSASQRAIVPVPAPTSRQRHPGATPAAPRCRIASGSNIAAIPPSRACSSASPLSKK